MSKTVYTKDATNKKMIVTREFSAPLEKVWQAWTDRNILDQWWAPKPWKAKTKSMDFKTGGTWLYAMQGPDGSQHWCRADYKSVVPLKSFEGLDCFCDENGNKNPEMPGMLWRVSFSPSANGTKVEVEITFPTEADMAKIIEMGFEQGFEMAHGNLDEVLGK